MTADTELENWKQEWGERTGPLPQWQTRIRRQNLWTAAAAVTLGVGLTLATAWAAQARTSFTAGLAVGMWLATLVLGSGAWWLRRGAWKPNAQTTLAYMELAHRRAVAKARQLQLSFYLLLSAILLLAIIAAWNWKAPSMRDLAILAVLGFELIYLRRFRQRKQREAERTRKLIDDMRG